MRGTVVMCQELCLVFAHPSLCMYVSYNEEFSHTRGGGGREEERGGGRAYMGLEIR